ncbi:MAG: SMP-30/gluconolactonase/LRE family protein [Myxococcota bacterium]
MPASPRTLIAGLAFAEGPRWHEGRLWLSDIAAGEVLAVDLGGRAEVIARVPFRPSGLGWLPPALGGDLLVVSMVDQRLLRLRERALEVVADLSPWCGGHANDMVVDARGRAYVGNLGFDLEAEPIDPRPTGIVRVDPDGRVRRVADGLMAPNGMVLSPDGATLIAAESGGYRLVAFDVDAEGDLSEPREFAALPKGATPDGICLDAEGCVWAASPTTREFLRVREGGEVVRRVPAGGPEPARTAIACMLGGPERRDLFLVTAATMIAGAVQARSARVDVLRVDVPGAGLP